MIDLGELITYALWQRASDIHLTVGLPPVLRIDGELTDQESAPLTDEDVGAATKALANEEQREELREVGECDFAVTFQDTVRMRCNIYHQQGHIALALRLLPMRIPTAEELDLPQVIIEQAEKPRGLVLITGPTGSGKSSTLAALLDHINSTERRHILTLEDPIEYIHERKMCVVNQREIGRDTASFAAGLRAALRQDPDVILVGEMRDLETISTAITAAETGHLVFGTLHTKGAANTVDRIVDVFPSGQQEQVRIQLADVLECAIGQTLLPKIGGGRRAVFEIMVGTSAVRNIIRSNKSFQLATTIQTSRKAGMMLLDDALAELVRGNEITLETALSAANDPAAVRSKAQDIRLLQS
ncbi:MAG: type IV pilus twitching motility protein PilT [Oscillospiraceae bacterium]|nr:type IV pilus twitching motility protein PilT [Oscillospiraceae bacterium]